MKTIRQRNGFQKTWEKMFHVKHEKENLNLKEVLSKSEILNFGLGNSFLIVRKNVLCKQRMKDVETISK